MKREQVLGYLLALAGALAYGAAQVTTRKGVSEMTTPLIGATISMFAGMVALAFLNLRDMGTAMHSQRRALVLVTLSGVFSSIGVTSMYFALSYVPVMVASPIASINPLLTLLYATMFLRQERITRRVVLGSVLVVGGVVLVTVGQG
ncbi:MAG: EamA family transporter [Chloroflexi bacterium]|nr:EamA family transporter [Chloroflexota bacterium]